MELTTEQKSYWIKNGFLKLKNVFGQDDLCQIKAWITKIETSPVDSVGGILHYYEIINGEKIITRSERYLNFSKELTDFITKGIIMKILEQLMGSGVVLFKEKINYKYPMGGGYAPCPMAHLYLSHIFGPLPPRIHEHVENHQIPSPDQWSKTRLFPEPDCPIGRV